MRRLFEICQSPTKIFKALPGGDHNSSVLEEGYFEAIDDFVANLQTGEKKRYPETMRSYWENWPIISDCFLHFIFFQCSILAWRFFREGGYHIFFYEWRSMIDWMTTIFGDYSELRKISGSFTAVGVWWLFIENGRGCMYYTYLSNYYYLDIKSNVYPSFGDFRIAR